MPIFEYACEKCGHRFEKLVFNGKPDVTCPSCHATSLRKLFSVFASASKASEPLSSCEDGPCGRCDNAERCCEYPGP